MNRKVFFAERASYGRHISLSMIEEGGPSRGMVRAASAIEMKEVQDGLYHPPMVALTMDESQQLMDELWRCGIRPTEGQGSAGMLAATERHLKDMQDISRAALKKAGIAVE